MFFGRSDHCHQWFYDGFLMLLPSMVPDHWSNDAMVSMDRFGLILMLTEENWKIEFDQLYHQVE